MKIFIALVFIVASVSANPDGPEDTRYFIKNANTNTYLYVDNPYTPPGAISETRNVCTLNIANQIPNPRENSLFLLVSNNHVGPYYNIINFGTNSVLFASQIVVGRENNATVTKVLAGKDTEYLVKPEALWNVRQFKDNLYIFNVHYGAYLYTNDNKQSAGLLDKDRRVAMLMPNEDGGRVVGTQWVLISNAKPSGNMSDNGGVREGDKVTEGEMSTVKDNKGGQVIREQIGKETGMREEGKEIKQVSEQPEVVDSVETNTREGGKGQESVVRANEVTFKAWVMMFNCHITTTRRHITTTRKAYWDPSWYTPEDRAGYPCAELRRFMSA